MKTVTLDMTTRLIVETILGQQKGTLDDLEVPSDILKRIKVPKEEKDNFLRVVRGQVIVDEEALAAAQPFEVELEKEEVKRLIKIFSEWPGFSPGDVQYVQPFIRALRDS